MTAFWGMDPEQVRSHADRLRSSAGEVEELSARLGTAVEIVPWVGDDAEAFRARWAALAAGELAGVCAELLALGDAGAAEADQQDAASAHGSTEQDSASARGSTEAGGERDGDGSSDWLGPADGSSDGLGYLHEDSPWLPNWLEHPAEAMVSGLAQAVSDSIGWGFGTGIGLLEGGLGLLGANTDGIAQFERDADHLGGVVEDWVTGERVPTVAEVGAAGLLATGSAGVGVFEAVTGEDTALLDDRPGGIVASVRTEAMPGGAPQDLRDLIVQNDALRLPGGQAVGRGQIGIQEVHRTDGGGPAYIVQVPPTEGELISSVPGAWGEQGNSRDWASNLRLVAGQQPAAMDDVRAAIASAGIPPGADVMLVGHSQGGIIADRLAADPGFNSLSGADGSYNVTHTFTVGSPVQTVVPAQASTQSVNVHHELGTGTEGFSGDPIAGTDLGGLLIDGRTLGAPNRHEVALPGYPVVSRDPVSILEPNHESTGGGAGSPGGYAGSVARATGSDPTLAALQRDLSGTYLGEGTFVAASTVVAVGRGEP